MTEMLETTAQLIFSGENFVSMPKVSDMLSEAIGADGVRITDVSLTGLRIEGEDMAIGLDVAFEHGETVLSVALDSDTLPAERRLARLAPLLYGLARCLPVSHVVWAGTALRIPRDTFIAGLAAQFGATAPELSADGTVAQIAPRRVTRAERTSTARPDAATGKEIVARMLPAVDLCAGLPSANANAQLGTHRHDAHVQAYHADLRATMIRDANEDELKIVEAERGPMPVEVRLSTWAISLTVATVSLPVAVPVMAYNIARGEDMRVASLAMGLAGLFLALDTSGAMAAVTSF